MDEWSSVRKNSARGTLGRRWPVVTVVLSGLGLVTRTQRHAAEEELGRRSPILSLVSGLVSRLVSAAVIIVSFVVCANWFWHHSTVARVGSVVSFVILAMLLIRRRRRRW